MTKEWRFIQSGYCNGAANMAIDEAILIQHSKGRVPPTLRFYGWSPAAFSLGYFQNLDKAVDLDRCRAVGVDCVRRLTGGRAILHDRELTYSVVAAQDLPQVSGSIIESYLKISRAILAGLTQLGLEAEMVENGSSKRHGTAACFDAPSWYEIVVDGRKLVGSAQTRKFGCVLQHGSIMLDMDVDKMFEMMNFPNDAVRNRIKEDFKEKACSVKSELGREIAYEEISEAILTGFVNNLDIKLVPGELTEEEKALAAELSAKKYQKLDWTLR